MSGLTTVGAALVGFVAGIMVAYYAIGHALRGCFKKGWWR